MGLVISAGKRKVEYGGRKNRRSEYARRDGCGTYCWPTFVLKLKTLLVEAWPLEYGEEDAAALLRLPCLSLPMICWLRR